MRTRVSGQLPEFDTSPRSWGEEVLEGGLQSDRVLIADGWAPQPRTLRGERLDHVFEECCDRVREQGRPDHPAVDFEDVVLTFDELDRRANQLARYLLVRGARAGDRIALLFDQPVQSYIGMLAILKINAAYIPLDIGFPFDGPDQQGSRMSTGHMTLDRGCRVQVIDLS